MKKGRQTEQTPGQAGGAARANVLPAERRAEIARSGANVRWSAPPATHAGVLRVGAQELPCFVLEDGRRVLSNSGMLEALSMSPGGYRRQNNPARPSSDRLARFVGSRSLESHVSDGLLAAISNPVRFRLPNRNQTAWGYEATVLADLCDAVLRARRNGDLQQQQQEIAKQAEILVGAFMRVGIIALVDEATGYQAERARDALHQILAHYIAKELLPWTKRFPDEFYREMFRLRKWKFVPELGKKPMMAGQLTSAIVYERLPPGVLEELRRKNPVQENGRRKHVHHQFLTEDVGHPHLERHLVAVTTLMRVSKTWRQFDRLLDDAFPRPGTQTRLAVDPEDFDT